MNISLPVVADQYVRLINQSQSTDFMQLFSDRAIVEDAGKTIVGRDQIQKWCQSEIFDANVSLDVIDVAEQNGGVVVKTLVDGNFDRTGLPDPLIIEQTILIEGDKIVRLTCKLANSD